jgi:hypothetical protein
MGLRSVLGGCLILGSGIWLTVRSTAKLGELDSEDEDPVEVVRESSNID